MSLPPNWRYWRRPELFWCTVWCRTDSATVIHRLTVLGWNSGAVTGRATRAALRRTPGAEVVATDTHRARLVRTSRAS